MGWTTISYPFGSTLTSAKMTQNQDNFTALAQGLSGAPHLHSLALNAWPQFNGLGDASLGDVVYSSSTNIASGLREVNNLTINSGVTLGVTESSKGFLVFLVRGTATIAGTIDLDDKGGDSVVLSDGGVGVFGGGGGGGAMRDGAASGSSGSGGDGLYTPQYTSPGGAGWPYTIGATQAGNPGSDANTNAKDIINRIGIWHRFWDLPDLEFIGGGGGGYGNERGIYTDAGNGGGTVIIIADQIDFTGTITATGTDGQNGGRTGAGGGGGGCIIKACANFIADTGSTDITGGTGGTGTDAAGGDGGDGYVASIEGGL